MFRIALVALFAAVSFSGATVASDDLALKMGDPETRVSLKMGDPDTRVSLKMGDPDKRVALKIGVPTTGLKLGETA